MHEKFGETFNRERERNVLFNDTLNTFYLRLYGVRHMVKDHSDSEKGNPLPPHRLLLSSLFVFVVSVVVVVAAAIAVVFFRCVVVVDEWMSGWGGCFE